MATARGEAAPLAPLNYREWPVGTLLHLGGTKFCIQGRRALYTLDVAQEACSCPWKQYHPGKGRPRCWHLRAAARLLEETRGWQSP